MARNKTFDPSQRLETARNLFWKKGYYATSMDELVNTMKVSRASMYDTYGDKHRLFLDSLASYAIETHAAYRKAAIGAASPLKAIEQIIKKAIARSFEEDKVCMTVKSSFELAPFDEEVKDVLQEQVRNLAAIFEDLLLKAREAGELPAEKDPSRLALFIVGAFAGLWQMQALFNDKQMVMQMGKVLIESLH